MRILVMGLPGSGKTTLAKGIVRYLGLSSIHLNADELRKEANDWDFSEEGRLRQARRMRGIADMATERYVVCDFVAPLLEMRNTFAANYTVWLNTIPCSIYEDTNKMFIPPTSASADAILLERNAEYWAPVIAAAIIAAGKGIPRGS